MKVYNKGSLKGSTTSVETGAVTSFELSFYRKGTQSTIAVVANSQTVVSTTFEDRNDRTTMESVDT